MSMKYINVLDIETMKEENKVIPYCICSIINDEHLIIYYSNKNIIIEFLEKVVVRTQENTIIYCHNINFDGVLIIETLMISGIKFDWFIRDLNIYWIKIYYLEVCIEIRCSYKLVPLSVEKLGSMIGISKKKFPHSFASIENLFYKGACPSKNYFNSSEDYEFFKNSIFDFKKISIEYCMQDVLIVYEVVSNVKKIIFKDFKNIFKSSYTFSSIAYKIFQKKYNTEGLIINFLSIEEKQYIEKSYYGGRTEVFGNPVDGEIVHYFDFSGMYGQCMLEEFPILKGKFKYYDLNYEEFGIHLVKVESDMDIPVLPYYHNGKLMFPNGIFISSYWSDELSLFLKKGGKVLMHYSSYVYEKKAHVFREFVKDFTKIREKGLYYKIVGKSVINGVYGSFALKEDESFTIILSSEDEFYFLKSILNVIKWERLGKCIIVEIKKDIFSKKYYDKKNDWLHEETKRNIAYASIIASKARIKLYKAIEDIIKDGARLYYTDTDSLIAGYLTNNLNKEIGEVKWSETYEDAVFISPKFYYLKNEKLKAKGVSNNRYSFEYIKEKFYRNEEIIFENQLQINKKKYILHQDYVEKKIKTNFYDKRIFTFDKKKTNPIFIDPDY